MDCVFARYIRQFLQCILLFRRREEKKTRTMNCPKLNVSRETHTTFTNEIQDNTGEKPSEKGLVFIQERKGTEIKSLSRDRVETTKTDNSVVSFLILLWKCCAFSQFTSTGVRDVFSIYIAFLLFFINFGALNVYVDRTLEKRPSTVLFWWFVFLSFFGLLSTTLSWNETKKKEFSSYMPFSFCCFFLSVLYLECIYLFAHFNC